MKTQSSKLYYKSILPNFQLNKLSRKFNSQILEKGLKNPDLIKIKNDFKTFTDLYQVNRDEDNDTFVPRKKEELNKYIKSIVQVDENEHPCFTDIDYVKRKQDIQRVAYEFNFGDKIPIIEYTQSEHKTWEYVTNIITPKVYTNCCREYIENFDLLKKEIGLSNYKIPQLRDISKVLESKTGFTIVPVGGLLSPRYFLNLLAFKVFPSTQFIRPLLKCEHNGEPDVLHEIIGHTSMLCDKNFADFSQQIGIASLGASNEDLDKLAKIYWFTIEYGLVKELSHDGTSKLKVYGGAIVPSIFEIDYALSMQATYHSLDFDKMQTAQFDYVNLSTNYFVTESIESMKLKFNDYSKSIRNKKEWIAFDIKQNKVLIKNNI